MTEVTFVWRVSRKGTYWCDRNHQSIDGSHQYLLNGKEYGRLVGLHQHGALRDGDRPESTATALCVHTIERRTGVQSVPEFLRHNYVREELDRSVTEVPFRRTIQPPRNGCAIHDTDLCRLLLECDFDHTPATAFEARIDPDDLARLYFGTPEEVCEVLRKYLPPVPILNVGGPYEQR